MNVLVWVVIGIVDILLLVVLLDAIENRIAPWWRRMRGRR